MSALPVRAAEPAQPAAAVASVTGLPLPRFVSVRAEPVNVRSGPGERYPVLWVLKKRGMPVQVIAGAKSVTGWGRKAGSIRPC